MNPAIPRALPWALCALLTLAGPAHAQVPSGRITALSRGVNLSHWFSQIPRNKGAYSHEWFSSYDRPEDFALIANAGFTHVRYPVEFEMFLDEANPDVLRGEFLPDFDAALDHILST